MGAIQDRTREHLGTSDKVIMANRRILLKAIETVRAGGRPPMALARRGGGRTGRPRHDRLHRAGRRWADALDRSGGGQARRRELAAPAERRPRPTRHRCAASPRRRSDGVASPSAAASTTRRAQRRATLSLARSTSAASSWCASAGATCTACCAARRWSPAPLPDALRVGVGMVSTHPAEGHLRPHRVPGVRAAASRRAARLRLRQQPAAAARPGHASGPAVGRQRPAGCRPRPGSRTARRCRSTRAASCRRALARLARPASGLHCGLEVEFHIYRLVDGDADPSLDPARAAWPGEPPRGDA